MKKYKLLIESPGIAKGSVVMQNDAGFYEIRHELSMYRTIFPDSQVENRPEVWEEITEKEEQEVNEYLPFQPKEGEEYWYVDRYGDICQNKACDSCGRHNVFRAKEAAEYEKLRQQSVSNRWRPKYNEGYYVYDYETGCIDDDRWVDGNSDLTNCLIGNAHRTEEEALRWGKMYSEAWKVLL